ncbi:MAG: SDR family oxidoreductase [Terriglobia bacterium]
MSDVLIAGCGYVGVALGARLHAEGHRVWGLRRNAHLLSAPVQPIAADLSRPETLHSFPSSMEYLFYVAAADDTTESSYQATYVEGIRNILHVLEQQKIQPRYGFFTSSTAVYAQQSGEWIDEDSPAESSHFTGARLLEAEQLLKTSPFPWTVVRLSGIYGPGRTRLLEEVRQGKFTPTGAFSSYTNRIHLEDCAGVLHHLMHMDSLRELYIGSDDEPAQLCDVVDWLAQKLNVAPIPRTNIRLAPENRFRTNKRCRNSRLVAAGYQFRFPTFREGYSALIKQSVTP